ncbi:hypothetical protein P171DRAFT_78459 [Karstenula rhodostoma CBS 690.94]|uniref:Zn(2)-C6 fungal-type domain-containing protein n=1 Tax=Karstenula rhodostoma CBS 690.94 TaxID=1392251 RepID=A0A9P4PD04_9PLEO|nr:hypothetical protein P171DRAFT_78459 [Karstenula rhodostoma CBS 690.94]
MHSVNNESRATTSCTECQRRKQKCSREWPCNHCQARKVPHLCQFGTKRLQQPSPPKSAFRYAQLLSRKSSSLRHSNSSGIVRGLLRHEDEREASPTLPSYPRMAWTPSLKKESSEDSHKSDAVEGVLHAIPPRSITDAIVNHFLSVVNYRYSAIYAPIFTDHYVQWWSDRVNGRTLLPEFTCLLLRVLSYSTQYLTRELRKMIEFELACSPQTMTDRFHEAAEQLSKSFSTSNACIERVQELFYKGAWLKSESRIVESWHSLGCTIRVAQELGLDKESSHAGLPEFDAEIRRRLWTLLYIWDWQMSAWLGRPHLIDQKDLSFEFPNLRLDSSASEPNLLSPFAHVALQANIARRIAPLLGDVQVTSDLSPDQVYMALQEIRNFINELPPVFRMEDPDLTLDEAHPYYVFQRYQLHVVIHLAMIDLLKPYLTGDPKNPRTPQDAKLRKTGVDIALKMLDIARLMFNHEFPINAKFHMVVFCIFDTATTLCSAIIHDVDDVLHYRERVMGAVENALDMLQHLSHITKLGASSYWFLFKLVQAAPVLSHYGPITKRQRALHRSDYSNSSSEARTPLPEQPLPMSSAPVIEPEVKPAAPAYNHMPVPEMETTDDLSFDLEQFLAQNPFGSSSNLDIGGMEVVWDWEDLNLDFGLLNNDAIDDRPQ